MLVLYRLKLICKELPDRLGVEVQRFHVASIFGPSASSLDLIQSPAKWLGSRIHISKELIASFDNRKSGSQWSLI